MRAPTWRLQPGCHSGLPAKLKYPSFCSDILIGRADDTSFERLLASIADYFIDNTAPAWSRQLQQAAAVPQQMVYTY